MAGNTIYFVFLCILNLSLAKPFQNDPEAILEDETTAPASNQLKSKGAESEEDVISGRINLDFGHSGSTAMRPGGASSSMSGANNFNVGLMGPYGGYRPLMQNSNSYGASNRFGNAPQTWSGTGGGYGHSGFNGGIGHAASNGFKTQGVVPIGNGMSLLSNLPAEESQGAGK